MFQTTASVPTSVPAPRRWERANATLMFGSATNAKGYRAELLKGLGRFDSPSPALRSVLEKCGYFALPEDVEIVVRTQKVVSPTSIWPEVEAFVRDSVTIASPHTVYAANLLFTIASRYVQWCVQEQGWPLRGEVIWSVQAIDLYATDSRTNLSDGTRRNYRAMLMRISEVLLPADHAEKTTPLSRKTTAAPYTPSEMIAFRRWPEMQTSETKRDRAMLMLLLCAGAGLRSNEIPTIYPKHVAVDADGIMLVVPGEKPREVPLLAEWEEWMLAILDRSDLHTPLWGDVAAASSHNLLSRFTERTCGPRPNGLRLRSTWLATHLAAGVPMKALFRAGGFQKFEHLPRLLEYVQECTAADYRASLRGIGER